MDKRGDLPITILVLSVLAVTSLTLLSFYISGIDGEDTILRVSIVEKIKSFEEETSFYLNQEINQDPLEIMDVFSEGIDARNVKYSGGIDFENGFYHLNGTHSEKNINLGIIGFGEEERIFSVEYRFRS